MNDGAAVSRPTGPRRETYDVTLGRSVHGGLLDVLETMDSYVFMVDQDCNVQYANRAARRDFGSPQGRKCCEYFGSRRAVCGCCGKEVALEGKIRQRVWYSPTTRKTYEVTDIPLENPDGTVIRLTVCRDIVDPERAREALRESLLRHRDFVNNSKDFLWRIDVRGRFSFASPAAKSMFGYESEELLGAPIQTVLTEDSRRHVHQLLRQPRLALEESDGIIIELTHRRKDGTEFAGESRWRTVFGPGGALIEVEGITRDVTGTRSPDSRRTGRGAGGKAEWHFSGMVARDPKMLEIFETINEVAATDVPVLIQGESGTGKELVATAIHERGPRTGKAFVPVNCSALPESLLESELYGHVRGAFSGAIRDKKGRFELADGGTIFLDEVGDLSPAVQVSLLRVLQEGTIERVGGEESRSVDVRVISATNRDLASLVRSGRFREDLFYRLCVIPIGLPPLRDRRTDIPLLADVVLKQIGHERGGTPLKLSPAALEVLMQSRWPGNIRQLQNVLHYASVKCRGETLEPHHLPPSVSATPAVSSKRAKRGRKRKLTVEAAQRALAESGGNKMEAAQKLGVCRATLYKYLTS